MQDEYKIEPFRKKLFIAGMIQETNGFSPIPTNLDSFDTMSWDPASGGKVPDHIDLLGYGAVWYAAEDAGFQPVLSLFASAVPARPLSAKDWSTLKDRIVDDLRAAMPVEAVFLALHGAMSADGVPDCEGDLLQAIRDEVGASVPIAAEYDLHGNVSRAMVECATYTIACREYPHTDHAERSLHCLDLLGRHIAGNIHPTTVALSLPLVGLFPTTAGPMAQFNCEAEAYENRPGILAVSAFHGFFAADIPDMGASIVVTTDGDPDLARSTAYELAEAFDQAATSVRQKWYDIDAAFDLALEAPKPVVIADRADNCGGGAAGDSTFLLQTVLDRSLDRVGLAMIWDPIAVELAHAAGEGVRLPLRVGGKIGPLSGQPVDLDAEILAVRTDVKQAAFGIGPPRLPIGRSAAIRAGGITVIICSERTQTFSRHVFTDHGLDVEAFDIMIVKSTNHFTNDFSKIAEEIIFCDARGTVTADYASLPYKHIVRPKWPLDQGVNRPPSCIYEPEPVEATGA